MKTRLYCLFLILLFTIGSESQVLSDRFITKNQSVPNSVQSYTPPLDSTALDSFILRTMQDYHMVGYAACVVKDDQVKWHHNYGYADLEKNIPVTDSTIFLLASIGKTILTTAVMQLWEDGLFNLDDDVNQYLPQRLQVNNPYYPDDPITFSMLLTHTSSIEDNWDIMYALEFWGGDSPISLDSLLVNYLIPGGKWYNAANFNNKIPGTYHSYSSMGFTLLGYLVERISGESLEDYSQQNIFQPLDMDHSSWFLSDFDISSLARHYRWDNNTYITYDFYGFPFYPAGQLRTGIMQLANFMVMYINKGIYHDIILLDSLTVKNILIPRYRWNDTPFVVYSGLGFLYVNFYFNQWLWGHDGAYYGVSNQMAFHPEERWGFICLSNTGFFDQSYDGSNAIGQQVSNFAACFDEIYVYAYKADRTFIQPETQSLIFQTRLANITGKIFTAEAVICSYDSLETDTIPIFDDGNHGDSLAGDGIWGNMIGPVNSENNYYLDVITTDLNSNSKLKMTDLCRFTSVGPLVYNGYIVVPTAGDSVINPGEKHKIKIEIQNMGQTATATGIEARIFTLDTFATVAGFNTYPFNDIPAGQTALSKYYRYIEFSKNFYGPIDTVQLAIEISSYDYTFWRDSVKVVVGVKPEQPALPLVYTLQQNYPNPFNPKTVISYMIGANHDSHVQVDLSIYNLLGQKVIMLVSEKQSVGNYQVEWDATHFASGVYFYRLSTGSGFVQTRKMVVMK